MSSERVSRANRGSKLQELLKFSKEGIALPEDDFYANMDEDSGSSDNEYDSTSEEDEVDSDFDDKEETVDEAKAAMIAETAAQEADKGKGKGKKKSVYVDPAKKKTKPPKPLNISTDSVSSESENIKSPGKGKGQPTPKTPETPTLRKSTRKLSIQKAEEREKRKKQSEKKKKNRPTKKPDVPKLTQAELLEEAKITEQYNTASLQILLQIEEQNKRERRKKTPILTGPRVIYRSSPEGNFYTFTELPDFLCKDKGPQKTITK